jgi:trigger factor
MQVSVENTGGLERRLTVQVPGDEIQEKINTKLREMSKQVRIKGFRPGRVPISVVKQRYGKQVRADIVNETIQMSLQQAIQDEKLRPASMPNLEAEPETLESGELEFRALVEVYPEIDKIDVSAIEIERPDAEVSDDDVDEMLKTLREQRQSWNPVERAAQEGDHVALEYSAEKKDGRVPEEGTLRMAIVLGQSGFTELEDEVISMKAGEEKTFKVKFPEGFREEELSNRKAKVDLKVASVSETSLPEVDEEFIKGFGVEDGTIESLKVEIRNNLDRELERASASILKSRLIDELIKIVPELEVPNGIVRQEAASMAAQMAQQQGQEPDPSMVELFMKQAEGRVRAGLLMGELAQQNEIKIDAAKVRQAIDTVASTYEQPEEIVQLYYSNQQLMQQVESSVMEDQVVDWVLENAKVTPKEMKFQEVISGATQGAK